MNERAGLLLLGGELVPGRLRWRGERITEVLRDPSLARAGDLPVISPGFIDLHVHGYGGFGPYDDLEGMARALLRQGTTGFCPTLFPGDPARLGADAEGIWKQARRLPSDCARVLGLHMEGPFVNPQAAGALDVTDLAAPSLAGLRAILGPASGDGRGIAIMTLAPELPGASELVRELVASGVRVSLGHSRASAADACAAAKSGAQGATHLYNAMGPFHHREAGLIGFALSSDAIVAEIIGDLVHVGPEAFRVALAAKGPRHLALVSDALRGAGSGCDVFESHGHVCKIRDGAIWTGDPGLEPRLTGAAASQLEAIRRLVGAGVLALPEALAMATEAPARALGREGELGRLVPTARADIVLLRAGTLAVSETIVGGRGAPLAEGR